MNNKIGIIFKKGLFFILIFTLFSCSINSNISNKGNKINNAVFSINKKTEIKIKE